MPRKRPESVKILPSDITPYRRYMSRRALLAGGIGMAAAQCIGGFAGAGFARRASGQEPAALAYVRNAALSTTETPNSYADITSYNNFYEFGTDKSDPSEHAQKFRTQP